MTEWSRSIDPSTILEAVILRTLTPATATSIVEHYNFTSPREDEVGNGSSVDVFNCSLEVSAVEFEDAIFTGSETADFCLSLAILFYTFVLLGKVCDGYLVPCVKVLCYKVGVSGDVAGATLLAGAVSSPDLFISLVGTFLTEGDIGLGTVFGCGIINVFLIPPFCLFLSDSKTIKLDWWPVTRDVLVNGISVLVLALALRDNLVVWHEAFLLVVVYLSYIIFMVNDGAIRKKAETILRMFMGEMDPSRQLLLQKEQSHLTLAVEEELCSMEETGCGWVFVPPMEVGLVWRFWWLITRPVEILLYFTIPDTKNHCLLPLTFLCCLSWVGGASYLSAWFITILGVLLHIPDSLMGLTLLAMGMSVPAVISSIIVARQGQCRMAVANALGSNIFDVLAVLGVPWLIKVAVVAQRPLEVNSRALPISTLIFLFTLSVLYLFLAASRFRITMGVAMACLLMYIFLILIAGLLEMNMIFIGGLTTCHL